MNVIYYPRFKRDIGKVNHRDLLIALREKIQQIEVASDQTNITGLKLLRGYSTHYRIQVKSERHSFRIGAIIRGRNIWLIRFLSRKAIYKEFP
jgi:hypothetical protein